MPWKDREAHRERIRELSRKSMAKARANPEYVEREKKYRREVWRKKFYRKYYLRLRADEKRYKAHLQMSVNWGKKNGWKINAERKEDAKKLGRQYLYKQLVKDGFLPQSIKDNPILIDIKRIIIKIKREAA